MTPLVDAISPAATIADYKAKCERLHYVRYDLTSCDTSWLPELIRKIGTGELTVVESKPKPIDMVLHCPVCTIQHIDAPDYEYVEGQRVACTWDNPPHRSHLCHVCGHIWRPADVDTNGVLAVKTQGKADTSRRPE